MDFTKYNQVPTEFATASTIGLAAATLAAMARRGLVEVLPGKPNKYRRIENPTIKIYQLLEENKDDYDEFFTLRKKDKPFGMLCWIKDGEMRHRGYDPDSNWYKYNWRGSFLEEQEWCNRNDCLRLWENTQEGAMLYPEHNDEYLKECIDNLRGKGVDVSEMEKLFNG